MVFCDFNQTFFQIRILISGFKMWSQIQVPDPACCVAEGGVWILDLGSWTGYDSSWAEECIRQLGWGQVPPDHL